MYYLNKNYKKELKKIFKNYKSILTLFTLNKKIKKKIII